jgi:hypothetical protein
LISSIPEYSKRISFYKLDDPSKILLENLKIEYTKPVTVLILHNKGEGEEERYIKYNKYKINFSFRLLKLEDFLENTFIGLKTFIENSLGDYDFEINHKDQFPEEKKFQNLDEAIMFYRKCFYDNNPCVLAMLNGEYDKGVKRINLEFKKHLHTIKDLPQNKKYAELYGNFFYVNATCYNELTEAFKISKSKLPSIVIYNSARSAFAKMTYDSEFSLENIQDFLREALEKDHLFRQVEKEIPFKNKYCQGIMTSYEEIDHEKKDKINMGLEDDDEEEENIKKEL